MRLIGSTSRRRQGLSRRDLLWAGGTGLAAGLLSPGLVGLAINKGAAAPGMDMPGHAGTTIGVPRAPYQRGAPLIEPEVRRSANGELRTDPASPLCLQGYRRISPALAFI